MNRYIKRIVMAIVVSSSCFIGTVVWFQIGKTENHKSDVQPVARLDHADNEVQRKPVKRVIWEGLSRNDELYPGEAIRTASNAEAQLFFMQTGTTVHLDPDSLIVLEQNDKGLSLDFLQGNLFVQSNDSNPKNGEGLTLKSGQSEIKLKSADMSLSKKQNGDVSLEVHRGEAELEQGNKKTALTNEKSAELSAQGVSTVVEHVQVLHPQAGETLLLNLTKSEKMELSWKPLAAGYNVSVETGANHNAMTKVADLTRPGASGHLTLPVKPGRWYLRLVATSNDVKQPQLSSSVIPYTIMPKAPPFLAEPRNGATVIKSDANSKQKFSWVDRNDFSSHVIEIAAEPSFRKIAAHENLDGDATSFESHLDDGTYYWRVTGFLKHEPLISDIGKFTLVSHFEVKPPVLISPANNQKLALPEVRQAGLDFRWQAPASVENFHVTIEHQLTDNKWEPVDSEDSDAQKVHLAGTSLKPGVYRWKVASIDPSSEEPKPSNYFQFRVDDIAKIEWVEGDTPSDFIFGTPNPSLTAHWKPLAATPAGYRYKLSAEKDGLDGAAWTSTKQDLFEVPVAAEGSYLTQVQAMNAAGQPIAQSAEKKFNVKRAPLLPAPQWLSDAPDVFKSDRKGNLTFAWDPVDGAQAYMMVLQSPDGQVVQQTQVTRNMASISRLKPGQYEVYLKSVDGYKRPGVDGVKHKVEVPLASDIRAPKIKAMKVK